MRTSIIITICLLLGMTTTASAQSLPTQAIRATDVLRVSYTNFHATIELQDDSVGTVLESVAYSGDAATRCLDLASDILAGKTPVNKITFFFEYESVATGSGVSVTPNGDQSSSHLPIIYNNVTIRNCSADKL